MERFNLAACSSNEVSPGIWISSSSSPAIGHVRRFLVFHSKQRVQKSCLIGVGKRTLPGVRISTVSSFVLKINQFLPVRPGPLSTDNERKVTQLNTIQGHLKRK